MKKGDRIQEEINSKLISIAENNVSFVKSAKKIEAWVSVMRIEDLNSYKNKNQNVDTNKTFSDIADILRENVEKSVLSRDQALGLLYSVGDLRQADFDYTKEYLKDLSGRFKGIHELAQDIQKTLDHASGKTPRDDKHSFMKALGNIFNWPKNQDSNKKKLKM